MPGYDNPKLNWMEIKGKPCLKFTFKGKLTEDLAVEAVDKWKRAFNTKPDNG